MPKFIVNISLIFTEHPILDRFKIARDQGFIGSEILTPYSTDVVELAKASLDCPVHLINTPFGVEWGRCADPQNHVGFQSDIAHAVAYSNALNCTHIHIMAGTNGDLQTFEGNLIWATQTYPDQSFLIEPLNAFDIPYYKLNNFDDAIAILENINAPNLGLQFDSYHASRIAKTTDIVPIAKDCQPWIKHIQVSGNPNRTEPDIGIVDHKKFFDYIDASNYTGVIGAEYHPKTNQFNWMKMGR